MKLDIDYIARLANIPLTDSEIDIFKPQLENIITFVDSLNEIDTSNIEPTSQVTGKTNELRDDTPQDGLTREDVLSNAPLHDDSYIITKGVFEDA